MKKTLYLLPVLLFAAISAFSQSTPDGLERKRTYDVENIVIKVSFNEKEKQVLGECTTILKPLDNDFSEFELDAIRMNIENIKTSSGTDLKYKYESPILKIFTGRKYKKNEKLAFTVKYNCFPKSGLYFVQPDSINPNKPWQIWTQGQGRGNDNWFPMYNYFNDKTTTETIVTVKDNYTVLSNGKLISVKQDIKNGMKTWHWKQSKPHVTYLVMLAIGEYSIIKDKYKNTPVDYYVYKGSEEDGKRCFKLTPDMIKFFSKTTGFEYPWEQYAQVVLYDFMYGGMENTSATTLNDKRSLYDKNTELDYQNTSLVAHELAHQWWGNLITQKDGISHWIHEGFATYFDALYHEYKFGKDEFMNKMEDNMDSYKADEKRIGKLPMASKTTPFVYVKGASFLHMLRFILGDDGFFKSVKLFMKRFAYKNAVTDDFRKCVLEATKKDLGWFFTQWLYKASYPEFDITRKYDEDSKTLELTVKQIQKIDTLVPYFRTPIDIEISTEKSIRTEKIEIMEKEQTFRFKVDSKPLNIIFDKGAHIVKKLNFQKTKEEYLYQLKNSKNAIDRKDAVIELRKYIKDPEVFKILSEKAYADPFWTVRLECLDSSVVFSRPEGESILLTTIKDQKSLIRSISAGYLGAFRNRMILEILKNTIASDSSYTVRGNALVSLSVIDPVGSVDIILPFTKRDSYREILKLSAITAFEFTKDPRAIDPLIFLAQRDQKYSVRERALSALFSFTGENNKMLELCKTLISDPDQRIRTRLAELIDASPKKTFLPLLNEWMGKESDEQLKAHVVELKIRME